MGGRQAGAGEPVRDDYMGAGGENKAVYDRDALCVK